MIVTPANGKTVAGAVVQCHPVGSGPMIKSVPEAETDENGRFTITGLELGAYALIAMKESVPTQVVPGSTPCMEAGITDHVWSTSVS